MVTVKQVDDEENGSSGVLDYFHSFVCGLGICRSVTRARYRATHCVNLVFRSAFYPLVSTKLIAKRGTRFERTLQNFLSIIEGFSCYRCLSSNSYLNTGICLALLNKIEHKYERKTIVNFEDGGFLQLDWEFPDFVIPGQPQNIGVILTGVTGSSQANYVTHIVDRLLKRNFFAVVMNYRGVHCSLREGTLKTMCGADTSDLVRVLELIKCEYPKSRIMAIGCSLGGVIISNLLADSDPQKPSLIDAAFVVSAPFDICDLEKEMSHTANALMIHTMVIQKLVKRLTRQKSILESTEIDASKIAEASTTRQFDEAYTCPVYGFENPDQYYKACSLIHKVDRIKVPTLYVNALDDMMSPAKCLPLESIAKSDYVAMLTTEVGGHLSFLRDVPSANESPYFCDVLDDYLKVFEQGKILD